MRIRAVTGSPCLSQGSGPCGLAAYTDMVKVYGMIELVLLGDNNYCVVRDGFIHGDVYAQEKAHQEEADNYNHDDLIFLLHMGCQDNETSALDASGPP